MTVTTDVAGAIEANVRGVRARISAACSRAGRDPAAVRLIAVSKTMPASVVRAAVEAGVEAIGENYVQEAVRKRAELPHLAVEWHLIGHLQSNKVPAAVATFDFIESVDSVRLARAISQRAARQVPILLEVNAGAEPSKSGFAPGEVAEAVRQVSKLPNIDLQGLMTVAPAAADPEQVRPIFRALAQLASANGLRELSMGMTGDFEVAIEEGSTMVRIGRAIFGERAR